MKKLINLFLILVIISVSVIAMPETTEALPKTTITKLTPDYRSVQIYTSNQTGSWDKIFIYRSTTKKSSDFKKIKTIYNKVSKTSKPLYTDTGLKFHKTYYYYIKTYYAAGVKKSAVKSIKTALSTVKGATYLQGTNGYDTFSWTTVTGASGYQIYRADTSKGTYKLVKTVGKKDTCKLKRPDKSKKYYYKICAYRKVDGNKYSGATVKVSLQKAKKSK